MTVRTNLLFTLGLLIALSFTGCGGGGTPAAVSEEVTSQGGTFSLGDKVVVRIPEGAVQTTTILGISTASAEEPAPGQPETMEPLGAAYSIDLGGAELLKPVTIEIEFVPEEAPEADAVPFLAFYDDTQDEWRPAASTIDLENARIVVETDHLSWWQPSSWLVDAIVQGLVTGLKLDWGGVVDAFAAFDGCSTENNVIIDESESRNYLGSCVERDDPLQPRLRIVNRRTFHVRASPVSDLPTDLPSSGVQLGRLERHSFSVDFSDVPVSEPFIVRAEVDWPFTFGHALLDLLDLVPGLDVATSSERILIELYRNGDFVTAAEALSSGDYARFQKELPDVLSATAEIAGRVVNFPVRLLLPVFRGLGAAGIALQFIDAARSASGGPGDLKFYSDRPAPTPTPSQPPIAQALAARGLVELRRVSGDATGDGVPEVFVAGVGSECASCHVPTWLGFKGQELIYEGVLYEGEIRFLGDGFIAVTGVQVSPTDPDFLGGCCPPRYELVQFDWNGSMFVEVSRWTCPGGYPQGGPTC